MTNPHELTPELREGIARWLCGFACMDPDEPISDGGHTVIQWVAHYDVPRLYALLSDPALQDTSERSSEPREASKLSPSQAGGGE